MTKGYTGMTPDIEVLKQVCERLGIPWEEDTHVVASMGEMPEINLMPAQNMERYKRNLFIVNLGLLYMAKIRESQWKGEDKKNFISALNKQRAKIRKAKNNKRWKK